MQEEKKLIGRILGLGLVGIVAGLLLDIGPCGDQREAIHGDPLACLFDVDSGYDCD
jgi:hypothetical protein